MKNNSKKILICSILLSICLLGFTVSYGFFEFYDETNSLIINSGLVNMVIQNRNSSDIALTNMFPESYLSASIKDNNYLEFTITSDNESDNDIYYSLFLDYGKEFPSKTRIRDDLLRFELIDVNENEKVFINESYDTINHVLIYVGKIDKEQNDFSKTFRVRVWISKDIKLGDTENNDYTLAEWNDLFASIKITVDGNNVYDSFYRPSNNIYYTFAKNAIRDDIGTVRNGVYFKTSTVNEPFHKIYFEGNTNSNLIFDDKCWKMVSTTSNGGMKLLYNGKPKELKKLEKLEEYHYYNFEGDENFIFDENTLEWSYDFGNLEQSNTSFSFSIYGSDHYYFDYSVLKSNAYNLFKVKVNSEIIPFDIIPMYVVDEQFNQIDLGVLEETDVITVEIQGSSYSYNDINSMLKFSIGTDLRSTYYYCSNYGEAATIGKSKFNEYANSPTDNAYYYGERIEIESLDFPFMEYNDLDDLVFGDSYTYDVGTNKYTITNDPEETNDEFYFCLDGTLTCTVLNKLIGSKKSPDTSFDRYFYTSSDRNYAFGNEYTYNESTDRYTITDSTNSWDYDVYYESESDSYKTVFPTSHYTCFTSINICETLYYVIGVSDSIFNFWENNPNISFSYVELHNGDEIGDILYKINNSPKTNKSTIAEFTDEWYEDNFDEYDESKLTDFSICMNRNDLLTDPITGPIYAEYLALLNGSTTGGAIYDSASPWYSTGPYSNVYGLSMIYPSKDFLEIISDFNLEENPDFSSADILVCSKDDNYSVNETSNSNGLLENPIGLLTVEDASLLGIHVFSPLEIGLDYWLATPLGSTSSTALVYGVAPTLAYGDPQMAYPSNMELPVRPVIALYQGASIYKGSGTYTDPYIVY